jgi:hypothetical protein
LNPATNRLWRLHYPQSECGHRSFIVNSQDATVITRFSEEPDQRQTYCSTSEDKSPADADMPIGNYWAFRCD